MTYRPGSLLLFLTLGCGAGISREPILADAGDPSAAADAATEGDDAGVAVDAGPRPVETGSDALGEFCTDGVPGLKLATSSTFQDTCYPDSTADQLIVYIQGTVAPVPGDAIPLSPTGSYAYVCKVDGSCETLVEGSITFETYGHGVGGSGRFTTATGSVQQDFAATWCGTDASCE